jgi:hypothetical protein
LTWSTSASTDYSCFGQCPRDLADTCVLNHEGWTLRDYQINDVGYYIILPVAVFELFFVLCFGRKSPEEIRDQIFRFGVGKNLIEKYRAMDKLKRKGVPKRGRILAAQIGAMVFYSFAALTYLVCIPFFIFSVIWQERLLQYFPDGEDMFEIGQWLPYVGE